MRHDNVRVLVSCRKLIVGREGMSRILLVQYGLSEFSV